MKWFHNKGNNFFRVTLTVLLTLGMSGLVAYASSTIGTNISTDGTLSVTGASTLTGNVTAAGTLAVTGASTLTGAVTATAGVTSGSNIISDTDSTDNLGSSAVRWASTFSDNFTGNTITLDGATGLNTITLTTNLADALSILDSAGDLIVFDTTTGTQSVTITPPVTVTGATTLSSTLSATGLATFLGGATTTTLTLLNGEQITNATDGTIVLSAATTSMTGATMSNGFLSQASSTVVGDLTVTGTFSPTQTSASSFTVTGATTLDGDVTLGDAADDAIVITGNASTTNSFEVGNDLYVNGYATTTGSNGNIATEGSFTQSEGFGSTGLTIGGAGLLQTDAAIDAGGGYGDTGVTLSPIGDVKMNADLWVNGNATTTGSTGNIETEGSLEIGNGTAINNIVYGYCDITGGTITASSSAYFVCTDTATPGALAAGHRVFVSATSSLAANFIIQAASSTAGTTADTISVLIYNTGYDLGVGVGADDPGAISFNFFGIR